jgi:hypothetical protein
LKVKLSFWCLAPNLDEIKLSEWMWRKAMGAEGEKMVPGTGSCD